MTVHGDRTHDPIAGATPFARPGFPPLTLDLPDIVPDLQTDPLASPDRIRPRSYPNFDREDFFAGESRPIDRVPREYQLSLPTLPDGSHSLKHIAWETMVQLQNGEHRDSIDDFVVVDCRFSYEFAGGHMKNAVNRMYKESIESLYKDARVYQDRNPLLKLAFVFHCEFSMNRGPAACQYFRELDRSHNTYPDLSFPEMYILDGGFRKYFMQKGGEFISDRGGYVSMWDKRFAKECKREQKLHRISWAKKGARKRGLSRSRAERILPEGIGPRSQSARGQGPLIGRINELEDMDTGPPCRSMLLCLYLKCCNSFCFVRSKGCLHFLFPMHDT
jgi:rhodanese-related sulfurtransferase